MKKQETSDENKFSFWRLVLFLCLTGGMVTFMAKTGYDPFPVCTCGELVPDSALIALAEQGDTLAISYLQTEGSDLMCAARMKELLRKLKEEKQETEQQKKDKP